MAGQSNNNMRKNQGGYHQGEPRLDKPQRQEQDAPSQAAKLPEDFVDAAEAVIEGLKNEGDGKLAITTSKIRRLFSLIIPTFNRERLSTDSKLAAESRQALMMARVRMVYEAGREDVVKNFIEKAKLREYIKGIGDNRESFIRFAHYMEALVAWHRYYGGREN